MCGTSIPVDTHTGAVSVQCITALSSKHFLVMGVVGGVAELHCTVRHRSEHVIRCVVEAKSSALILESYHLMLVGDKDNTWLSPVSAV